MLKKLAAATAILVALSACTDREAPTAPTTETPTTPDEKALEAVGVYRFTLTGISSDQPSASVTAVNPETGEASASFATASGLTFEQISSASFTDGSRASGGQRYYTATFRVRNMSGGTLNNLHMLLVQSSRTLSGSFVYSPQKFTGAAASASIGTQVAPTGAVTLGSDPSTMISTYPDVLQVFSEAEVAAISLPATSFGGRAITSVFPLGYVVRNRNSTTTRALPSVTDANQFDGVMTMSFRLPLQPSAADDIFTIGLELLAVTDTETRMTESMEEAQDTAAVRRIRERAAALGATTVTVLNGSTVTDPSVTSYTGQRQFCSVRTAGTAGAPTAYITTPAAYQRLLVLNPGESRDTCAANFRSGTASRPATGVPFSLTAMAIDRYGNLITSAVDTVKLQQMSGPTASVGSGSALSSGQATVQVTYSDYGSSQIRAYGRRNEGFRTVPVAGVTRTWTGAVSTAWNTGGNWSPAAVPMSLDSVTIPVTANNPILGSTVSLEGVNVDNGATVTLGVYTLTANANVTTGTSGGINSTTGILILTGTAKTLEGVVPRTRVSGTYSLTNNVTARAPVEVYAGRITASAFRLTASSN